MIKVNEQYRIDVLGHGFELLLNTDGPGGEFGQVGEFDTLKDACEACYKEMMIDLIMEKDMTIPQVVKEIIQLKRNVSDLIILASTSVYDYDYD